MSPSWELRAPSSSLYHLVPKHLQATWPRLEQSHLLPEACSPDGTDNRRQCQRQTKQPLPEPSDILKRFHALYDDKWHYFMKIMMHVAACITHLCQWDGKNIKKLQKNSGTNGLWLFKMCSLPWCNFEIFCSSYLVIPYLCWRDERSSNLTDDTTWYKLRIRWWYTDKQWCLRKWYTKIQFHDTLIHIDMQVNDSPWYKLMIHWYTMIHIIHKQMIQAQLTLFN